MKLTFTFCAFLLGLYLNAQTVSGVVYDSISKVENIRVENLNSKKFTITDSKGHFSISAKVNDSLKFSSIFYHDYLLIVKPFHLQEEIVIEIKQINNTLDEVVLKDKSMPKQVSIETVETNLQNQILEDIKNNPHLYGKLNDGGIDFIKLFGMIGKLFKNKNKEKPIVYATYEDLTAIFENSKILDHSFFTSTLKIEDYRIDLFIQYLEASQIDNQLLKPEKEVYFIELLLQSAKDFNTLVQAFNDKE